MPQIERIDANPEYAELASTIGTYEKRLTEAVRRRERALAIIRGAKSGRSVEEQAELLVRGAQVAGIDPFREIDAADREISVMRDAIRKKSAELDAVAGNLSEALCIRVEPEHTGYLRTALKSLQDANAAFMRAAELRAAIRNKGYSPLGAYLSDSMPPAMLALGTGDADGRQLDLWRRYVAMHSPSVKL